MGHSVPYDYAAFCYWYVHFNFVGAAPTQALLAIGYSVISPIINGLAFATFCLFYLLYKYLFLWVYQEGTDTGGLFFPKAIQHLFVGLYVEQVCLAALFFLSQGKNGHPGAIPEGALMIVLIIFTVRSLSLLDDDVHCSAGLLPRHH